MVGAGLLAPQRRCAGLHAQAVGQDAAWRRAPRSSRITLKACDLLARSRQGRLQRRRLRLHDVHRQLGPAARRDRRRVCRRATSSPARVLSGNRNFEGRIHPQVKMNYLGVAAARRRLRDRRHHEDRPHQEPLGTARTASRSTCKRHLAVDEGDPRSRSLTHVDLGACSRRRYADVFQGDERGRPSRRPRGRTSRGTTSSTYVQNPPFFEGMTLTTGTPQNIKSARVLAMLGDSRDDGPHLAGRQHLGDQPGQRNTWRALGVTTKDFNSYGARRGNHEVMVRGTFANIRLKNCCCPAPKAACTVHIPSGDAAVDLRRVDEVSGRAGAA